MTEAQPSANEPVPVIYCVNHPQTPTSLRCNRCGNPICIKCAVRTPVGYRCKTCVRSQQDIFYSATSQDYVVAAIITLPLALIGQIIGPMLGFFALFAGPIVGGLIAEIVWRANGKRRGRYIWLVVAACIVIAALPVMISPVLALSLFAQPGGRILGSSALGLIGLLWPIIYLVLAVGSAIARLRFGK